MDKKKKVTFANDEKISINPMNLRMKFGIESEYGSTKLHR